MSASDWASRASTLSMTGCGVVDTRWSRTSCAAWATAAAFDAVDGADRPLEIRLVALVDRVDRVVDRALDHREAERRERRSLAETRRRGRRGAADHADGVLVPDEDHVGRLAGQGGRGDGYPHGNQHGRGKTDQRATNRRWTRSGHGVLLPSPPDTGSTGRRVDGPRLEWRGPSLDLAGIPLWRARTEKTFKESRMTHRARTHRFQRRQHDRPPGRERLSYQPSQPGSPFIGPTIRLVTQPP